MCTYLATLNVIEGLTFDLIKKTLFVANWLVIFGPKVGQIGSKWDKSGTFSD